MMAECVMAAGCMHVSIKIAEHPLGAASRRRRTSPSFLCLSLSGSLLRAL